jgi:threonyl-tRNA synthetase
MLELAYVNVPRVAPARRAFSMNRLQVCTCGHAMQDKYWEYEYDEVITPNMFNFDLWRTSGHADHYKANMFMIEVEKAEFGLKPMNCPAHCLMFAQRKRSYRELPMRYAEFGVLHRNEFSGALHGLTRVRRFVQDDAHIFCTSAQVWQRTNFCLTTASVLVESAALTNTFAWAPLRRPP